MENIREKVIKKMIQHHDDKFNRNSKSDAPCTKCVTDISEFKAKDGKLYVSAIFDCYDAVVVGLALDTNMKAPLVVQTLNSLFDLSRAQRGYNPL